MYRQTNVKTVCTDVTFLAMLDLLEIELSSRAHEDDEEKRRQKSANVAIAASAAAGKGSGKGKHTTKPTCRDYLTHNGCTRGGQCSFLHPPTVGRCPRCGSTKHALPIANDHDRRRPHFHPRVKVNHHHPRHHHQRPTTTTTKVEAKVMQEQRLRISQNQRARLHRSQRQKLVTLKLTGLLRLIRILLPHLQSRLKKLPCILLKALSSNLIILHSHSTRPSYLLLILELLTACFHLAGFPLRGIILQKNSLESGKRNIRASTSLQQRDLLLHG